MKIMGKEITFNWKEKVSQKDFNRFILSILILFIGDLLFYVIFKNNANNIAIIWTILWFIGTSSWILKNIIRINGRKLNESR